MTKTEHAPATNSRRTLLTGLAAAAVVPASALTTALGNADPILAAIAAHKAAQRAFDDAVHERGKLETALPRELRRSYVNADGQHIIETDDPRWIAIERAVDETSDEVHQLALALLDIRPTTSAAMVTLFRYVAAEADEAGLPDNVLMDDQGDSDDGVDFQTALLLTAAGWLENAGSLRA